MGLQKNGWSPDTLLRAPEGAGFRGWGFGFRGLGFRGLVCRVYSMLWNLGFRVRGCRVSLGLRPQGFSAVGPRKWASGYLHERVVHLSDIKGGALLAGLLQGL